MKPFIVAAIVSSLFLFWIIGKGDTAPPQGGGLGTEVYIKDVKATSTMVASGTVSLLTASNTSTTSTSTLVIVTHISTPEHVKAIYMSSWVAGTPSVRARLITLINETELNAVVIDVKDNTGVLSWDGRIRDLDALIKELHDKNIYVIARIASFQDPAYVKLHPELAVKNGTTGNVWRDHKGVPWVDTGSKVMWEYLANIGKDSYVRGFDELNFDYIRFPTDGDLKSMRFPVSGERGLNDKKAIVTEFYKFLHDTFSPLHIPISGDLFGIIATNANETKTLGQDLGIALTYFDYVALMVYPSHFYPGTAGYQNPAAHPREIIEYSTLGAVAIAKETASSTRNASGTPMIAASTLIAKLRPWYQDFDMGATYTKEMVRVQISAGEKFGVHSWMLWDPANKYTPSALLSQ
jgi:hypothetical protein